MNGHVDSYGRALVAISIRGSSDRNSQSVEAWIDTGFTGDLVLPDKLIDDLALPQSGTIKAILADGSEVALKRYSCVVDWFGEARDLEVVANAGECALLGVALLLGHDLHISYQTGQIRID